MSLDIGSPEVQVSQEVLDRLQYRQKLKDAEPLNGQVLDQESLSVIVDALLSATRKRGYGSYRKAPVPFLELVVRSDSAQDNLEPDRLVNAEELTFTDAVAIGQSLLSHTQVIVVVQRTASATFTRSNRTGWVWRLTKTSSSIEGSDRVGRRRMGRGSDRSVSR